MARPKLIVVLGTTACGKSGLGVELARRFNGEVVSADSRQVYQGLDLGTGKVTEEEMMGIPHHLLDVAQPNDIYSVADFQKAAYAAIDDILARGRNPFLVGGTGLYVRAVTEGFVFSNARPDPVLRARLEGLDTAALYALWREKTRGRADRRGGKQPPPATARPGKAGGGRVGGPAPAPVRLSAAGHDLSPGRAVPPH